MLMKPTPENQTDLILEDMRAWQDGEKNRPHYGVMTHVLLLSRRLDKLAQAMSAGTAEPAAQAQERSSASAVPNGDAPK